MTIKHIITAASVAANVTGLLSNATGAAGAGWALTANAAGDSLAHLITIKGDAVTDHSAKTAIITGTLYGVAQTETVALPNGTATVTSTKYFSTVTSVSPSATIGADTMDIGWAAGSVSAPASMRLSRIDFMMGFGCTIDSGTPTYGVQQSYDGANWFNHAAVTNETTAQAGEIITPVEAVRLVFTAAGGVTFTGLQSDAR